MAQNVRNVLTSHSSLDGTTQAITGDLADENDFALADILDGQDDRQLNDQGGLSFTKVEIGTSTQLTHSTEAIIFDSAVAAGTVTATEVKMYAGKATGLGQDEVMSIWSSGPEGIYFLELGVLEVGAGTRFGGLIMVQTTSSPTATTIMDNGINLTTTDLTGTTGFANQVALSVRQGVLEVQQRRSGITNTTVTWKIFG